jgi:hypothetical protein
MRVASFAMWVAFACHRTHATALPDLGAASLIAIFDAEGELSVFAWDVGAEEPSHLPFPARGDVTVWLLAYTERLDAFELEPGWVPIREDGAPLPEPIAVRVATLAGSDAAWEDAALPERLRELRLPLPSKCVELDEVPVALPSATSWVNVLAALDDSTAITVTTTGQVYRIDLGSGTATHAGDIPEDIALAGGVGPDGMLWMVGSSGATARVDPSDLSRIERFETLTATASESWIALSRAEPVELYHLTNGGVLAKFDGERWEIIARSPTRLDWRASLAWVGPSEVYATRMFDPSLVHYVNGSVEFVEVADAANKASELFFHPIHGLILGFQEGFVLRRDAGWTRLAAIGRQIPIHSLAAEGDGFIAGVENGGVYQWQPGEACPTLAIGAHSDVDEIVPVGRDFIVISDWDPEEAFTPVTILRRRDR